MVKIGLLFFICCELSYELKPFDDLYMWKHASRISRDETLDIVVKKGNSAEGTFVS